MCLTLQEIRTKAVVNLPNGICFGYADDLVVDTETKSVMTLVIKGKLRFFGLFGRERDVMIPWDRIEVIGEDTILVKMEEEMAKEERKWNFIEKIFNN